MGQQARSGNAALNRAARCGSLHDRHRTCCSTSWAHMANHHKAGRYVLQDFGNIFAKLLQCAAALRAGPRRAYAYGLRAADAPAADAAFCPVFSRRRCLGAGGWLWLRGSFIARCFQLFKLQFQLLDLPRDLLRAASKLHAPQLGDQSFRCSISFSLERNCSCCAQDDRLQCILLQGVQIGHRRRRQP